MQVLTQIDPNLEYITAHNCVEGFELLTSHPNFIPDYFMNLNRPFLDGKEGMGLIKNIDQLSKVPVIVYKTSSDINDIEETRKLGAIPYFVKPSDLNYLFKKLTELFKNQISTFLIKQPDNYGRLT